MHVYTLLFFHVFFVRLSVKKMYHLHFKQNILLQSTFTLYCKMTSIKHTFACQEVTCTLVFFVAHIA